LVPSPRPDLARRRSSRSRPSMLPPVRFDVSGFELSWPSSPLQSLTGPGCCVPLRAQLPPMGFVPLRRLRSRQPTCTGLPRPCVAPSGFVGPPGALLLPRPPRPCFVPRTPVGFTLRSLSLRGEGPHLSMCPCPHAVGSAVRGFRRAPRPAAGPCSPRKSVAHPPRGPGGRLDAPLGLHLFRGFFPSVMARGFPRTASHELRLRACSPECRSRPGRFVSAETTAPLEVRAPRAGSRDSKPARPWLMISPRAPVASLLLGVPLRVVAASPVGHGIGCRCRSRFARCRVLLVL
jgi:hypothetical protein